MELIDVRRGFVVERRIERNPRSHRSVSEGHKPDDVREVYTCWRKGGQGQFNCRCYGHEDQKGVSVASEN